MVKVEIQGESFEGNWIVIYSENDRTSYFDMKGYELFYMTDMYQDIMKYNFDYYKTIAINEMKRCKSFSEMKEVLNNYNDIIIPDWYPDLLYWYIKLMDISEHREIQLRIAYLRHE